MEYTRMSQSYFLETGTRFPRRIIWAMGCIKAAAARANMELGLLDRKRGEAIVRASRELAEGMHDGKVIVDVYQTGSGTGLNMNVNEVIAERASQLAGVEVHPNDHVNMSQSSNDVVPTAIRLAALAELRDGLLPELEKLASKLEELGEKYANIVKPGRTHLRDALPVTLGVELASYAPSLRMSLGLLAAVSRELGRVPLGGTAVGTGLNAHPGYPRLAVKRLSEESGLRLEVEGLKPRKMKLVTDLLALSSVARLVAVDVWRLSQDLRLMFSGPRTGLNEIDLEVELPGSSMMPGKKNPVTLEAVMQASAQVMGIDSSVLHSSLLGEFELSMGLPLVGYNVVSQLQLLAEALRKLREQVLERIKPNRARMEELARSSLALVTVLSPVIGYERASKLAERLASGASLLDAAREVGAEDEVRRLLENVAELTRPGIPFSKTRSSTDEG
jgi:fumarate hydratase class II